MIDLHTHTNYSDGTWDVKKLLKNAETNGVKLLSITDHDSVKAHIELQNNDYSNIFSGKILSGSEFNCVFNNAKIELLGYNFNVNEMNKWIDSIYKKERINPNLMQEFRLLMDACHRNKVRVDDIKYEENMGWPIDYIYESLKKYPENKKLFSDKEWNDIDYFFRCCTCNMDFPLYIDFSNQFPNAEIVSSNIRKLGGKVFIAHLFTYPLRDYKKYLDLLVSHNIIDGVEVYYSKFTDEQISFLEDYCKKNNLFMSVGTDCHGDKRSDRKIGIGYGNMNYCEEIVSEWL